MTNLLLRLQVWLGVRCIEHGEVTWWDNSYGKARCSVTGQPVAQEKYHAPLLKKT